MSKKRKKNVREVLVGEIERMHPRYIRNRDGNKCVLCGSMANPNCGHIFTRRNKSTRWDLDDGNCHCQCASCNIKHQFDQWPYFRWFQNRYGLQAFEKLRERHRVIKQHTIEELQTLHSELEKRIEGLGLK